MKWSVAAFAIRFNIFAVYFALLARRTLREDNAAAAIAASNSMKPPLDFEERVRPSFACFRTMASSAVFTVGESALRSTLYLSLVQTIVQISDDYATGKQSVRTL